MNDKPTIPPSVAEYALDQLAAKPAPFTCAEREHLLSRLAKYEDAEGNPASSLASLWSEIERCDLIIESQAREIERLKTNMDTLHRAHCELAALKAQPSGVVLPERVAMAKALCKHHSEQCGVNSDDQWKEYNQHFIENVEVMLAASTLSANHSEQVREWVSVSERLPDETHAYGCHTNDVLCRTRSGKVIVALLARTTTGDVWYDQQSKERDVTHWMPLPAPPSAGSQEQGE